MFLKVNIPKEKYYSTEFDQNLKILLNNTKFSVVDESRGLSKTTCNELSILPNLKNFREIFEPILFFYINFYVELSGQNKKNVIFTRMWVNEIFKGCSGTLHDHKNCDGVAVFYYKVPKNSSHFVVVHPPITKGVYIDNYSLYEKSYIRVEEGDLIIHNSQTYHGVSEHLSDDSRICFVFDFKIE